MSAKGNLNLKVRNLKAQLVKEWIKQAYFRIEHKHYNQAQQEKLTEILEMVREHVSFQDTLMSEACLLTGTQQSTPRFISSSSSEESVSELLSSVFSEVRKLTDKEYEIINQYRNFFENNPTKSETSHKLFQLRKENQELINEVKQLKDALEQAEQDSAQKFLSEFDECGNCKNHQNTIRLLRSELEKTSFMSDEISFRESTGIPDLNHYKDMYENLRKKHEKLLKETKNKIYDSELLEELTDLRHKTKQLKSQNVSYDKKYKDLESYVTQLEEEALQNTNAIQKAQEFIKKLNNECSSLSSKLEKSEKENHNLKSQNKELKLSELEKNESDKLWEELAAVQSKYTEMTDQKSLEIKELNETVETLLQEKSELEEALEELQEKFGEIEEMSQQRVTLFYESCQRIQELENLVNQKDSEIRQLSQKVQVKQNSESEELNHLKFQVQNVVNFYKKIHSKETDGFRRLQPLRVVKHSDKENIDKNTHSSKPLNTESLNQQLELSLAREKEIYRSIINIVEKEGSFLGKRVKELKLVISSSKPEIEALVMRSEELEQRLVELQTKNLKLTSIVKDLQKTVIAKNKQIEEQKLIYENLNNDNSEFIQVVTKEFKSVVELVNSDVLDFSSEAFKKNLSSAHEKISNLKSEITKLNGQVISEDFLNKSSQYQKLIEETCEVLKLQSVSELASEVNSLVYERNRLHEEVKSLQDIIIATEDKQKTEVERLQKQVQVVREIAKQDSMDKAKTIENMEKELKLLRVGEEGSICKTPNEKSIDLPTPYGKSFESQEKLSLKLKTAKYRYMKKLREFEFVLRFIESKVNEAEPPSEIQEFINKLPQKNTELYCWVDAFIRKIENLKQTLKNQETREKWLYQQVINSAIEKNIRSFTDLQRQLLSNPDLEKLSLSLLGYLKPVFDSFTTIYSKVQSLSFSLPLSSPYVSVVEEILSEIKTLTY